MSRRAVVTVTNPPPISCSYRRHSSSRLTPMMRGPICARNQAAPTTPIRYVTAKATGMRLMSAAASAGWQSQAPDGVAGGADGRGLGERAGDDAGGGPGVIAEETADDVGHEEAGGRDDRRQDRLLQAVALQPAEELRARPEPDREQEQQEEALLDLARHLDAELADQHAGQQGPGDRAEREASQLHLAEQVAHPEDEEERDLGMVPQDADERLDHGRPPTVRRASRPPPVRPGRP